jgi:SAM-dependent methyltransferase
MTAEIAIPADAYKYILDQRTQYMKVCGARLFRMIDRISPWSAYRTAVAVESRLCRQRIRRAFSDDMASEYATISEHLPESCQRILDVGCGVGGINALLFEHYGRNDSLQFHLLDKTQINRKIFYGFKSQGAFYNSLKVATKLLEKNGVPNRCIVSHEVDDQGRVELPGKIDLAISLISWGYHYPVSTYLDRVHASLSPHGKLILDVRCDVDGERELADRFARTTVLAERGNARRILAEK